MLNHKLYSKTEQNTAYSNTKFLLHIIFLLTVVFVYKNELISDKKFIYFALLLVTFVSKFYSVNPERIVEFFLPLIFLHIFNRLKTGACVILTLLLLLLSTISIPVILGLY